MTKMPIAPLNRVFAVWPKRGEPYASHKKVMLIGTGGFQKGYMDRAKAGRVPRGSYVEQRTLPPVVLGAPTIKVVWNTRDHHGERHLTPTIKAEV